MISHNFSRCIAAVATMCVLVCCTETKKTVSAAPEPIGNNCPTILPKALVYKTKNDYAQYVPVLMNPEKNQIVSYPHPKDVFFRGQLAYPTPLCNGYLLDNRGIGPNVAFLNITYDAYSKMKAAPTEKQLMSNLLDTNPLIELWECGQRVNYKDEINALNALIVNGFPNCDPLVRCPYIPSTKLTKP